MELVNPPETKYCPGCEHDRLRTEFYTSKRDGISGNCKVCARRITRNWYRAKRAKLEAREIPSLAKRENILSGPKYFRCESMRARLQKIECVRRQKELKRTMRTKWGHRFTIVYEECCGCLQGKLLRKAA